MNKIACHFCVQKKGKESMEEIKLRMQNKIDKLKVNKRNNVNSVSCDNSSFINISRDNNSISV